MERRCLISLGRSARAVVVILSMLVSLGYLGYSQGTSTFDFCWRDTHGRGAGVPLDLNSCNNPSLEKDPNGLLCYPKCNAGFKGVGPVCWQTCPAGFRDDGAYCAKPDSYGRGAGYPWQLGDAPFDSGGQWSRCNRDNSQGCEQPGGGINLVYPKCKPNFHTVGLNVCSPDCPSNMPDIGVSCQKASYGRGAGDILGCPAGTERSGLLCYPKCSGNSDGVGPTCWDQCPSGWVQCGMGCAPSTGACASATTDQVVSVVSAIAQIAAEILTAGAASGAMEAKNEALQAAKASEKAAKEIAEKSNQVWLDAVKSTTKSKKEIDAAAQQAKQASKAAEEASSQVKNAKAAMIDKAAAQEIAEKDVNKLKLQKVFSNQGALTKTDAQNIALKLVKPENRFAAAKMVADDATKVPHMVGDMYDFANDPNLTDQQKQFKIAQAALDFASAADPTGVMAIVDAYTKPLCSVVSQTVTNPPDAGTAPKVGIAKKSYPIMQSDPPNSTVGAMSRCTAANPQGCEVSGNLVYAKCQQGYVDVGLFCNPPGSPSPNSVGGGVTAVAGVSNSHWAPMIGNALAIGANAHGVLWAIGNNPGNDHAIYKFVGTNWQMMPGAATHVAVDPAGNAWVVNSTGNIFRYTGVGSGWQQLPGAASDIAIGANGSVWVIGGGGTIYRLKSPASSQGPYVWEQIPGGGSRIAVGPDGNAWVVNAGHQIYRFNGSSWALLPGAATAIAIDAGGLAYVVGLDGQVYHWMGTNWTQDGTTGENLAGGAAGVAYVTKSVAEKNAIMARAVAP